MKDKLTKWKNWLEIIKADIQDLVIAKREFHEVQRIINANPKIQKSNSFCGYLAGSYVSHTVIGLRRQIKSSDQSISFARLMQEMIDSPETVSRKDYIELYKNTSEETLANQDFNLFCDAGSPFIKASLICDDLSRLRTASKSCEDYADKRVAHRDKHDPKNLPTFNDLDNCIDVLDTLYVKYHLLFYAKNMETLLPTRQFDSDAIFREAWITS
ncbi:MAG: hypothetical protein V4445_04270 [Pseudomonadota bacterium]